MSRDVPDAWDETARRLGWIVINAARLEVTLAQLTATLVGSVDAHIMTVGQNWATNLQACGALLEVRIDRASAEGNEAQADLYRDITERLKRANSVEKDRSHVVHAIWTSTGETELEMVYRASQLKRWGKNRGEDWTADRLGALVVALRESTADLHEAIRLVMRLPDEPPTAPS